MKRLARVVVPLLVLLSARPAFAAPPALPHMGDVDIPVERAPDARVQVFWNERYSFEEGAHVHSFTVPDGDWARIVLHFDGHPDGDPWDRLFGIAIDGVEVLRGTTPRAEFSLRKDVTRYASLMPSGQTVDMALRMGTYVGAQLASVSLEFYAKTKTALLVAPRADQVVGAFLWGGLGGNGQRLSTTVEFPDAVPHGASIELMLSGHGDEEFWYLGPVAARTFHILVDGKQVAKVVAMPYTYALIGFDGSTGNLVHPYMWWTAQLALDRAGVHPGVGEVAPYVAQISKARRSLLTGERHVEVVQDGGLGYWVTSLSFVLGANA